MKIRARRRVCSFCGKRYRAPRHGRWTNHKCAEENAAQVGRMQRAAAAGDADALEFARKLEEARKPKDIE